MQLKQHWTVEVKGSTVDLRHSEIRVHDSDRENSVTITGIEPEAIYREVHYWTRSRRYAHDAEGREAAKRQLGELLECCQEGLAAIAENEKQAEAAA